MLLNLVKLLLRDGFVPMIYKQPNVVRTHRQHFELGERLRAKPAIWNGRRA